MTEAISSLEDRNTAIVLDMWQRVIREGDRSAVLQYIAPDYIQHNVNMPSGRDHLLRLVDMINDLPADFTPPHHKTLVKTVAEGDFVVVMWDQPQDDPHNPGETYIGSAFDMYRLDDGMIVEHWDDTRKWPKPW